MAEAKTKTRTPWVSSRHEFVTVEKASERLHIPLGRKVYVAYMCDN